MAINHEAPWKSVPGFAQKQLNTTTWGASANACTIVDGNIHINSMVFVQPATAPAGFWSYVVTQGQVVITSSDSENSALALTYIVL